MVYQYEWVQAHMKEIGSTSEGLRTIAMSVVPMPTADHSKLVDKYGDEYMHCTHWLIVLTVYVVGGDPDVQYEVSTFCIHQDGSSPQDTPMTDGDCYEDIDEAYVAFHNTCRACLLDHNITW